jgi:transposase InsO family protein
MAAAIELKKEQPYRSDRTINHFLQERYGRIIPRSTLYRHLNQAGATRVKLGVSKMKVRKRIVKDHTHDLWVGDFEEGPYVIENGEVLPTYLCAFIDHYSRYVVDARYYLRQSLDILVDSWMHALGEHGACLILYVDNAKVYHSIGLRTACYLLKIRLKHRPKGEPETGGVIERFFETAQSQFEREVRAGEILSLERLNRAFSAWLHMAYHKQMHTEIKQMPEKQYRHGLLAKRHVDLTQVMKAFMVRVQRTVNPTYADIRLDNKFYRCDPKLRGDRIEVRYDPFSSFDSVEIYSNTGQHLQTAHLHKRRSVPEQPPIQKTGKPENNYLDLLVRQHEHHLSEVTGGIDYRKVVVPKRWPFHEFAKTMADLLGLKGGLSAFDAGALEGLKKTYNQSTAIDKAMLKMAFEKAHEKSLPYVIHELKLIIHQKENH